MWTHLRRLERKSEISTTIDGRRPPSPVWLFQEVSESSTENLHWDWYSKRGHFIGTGTVNATENWWGCTGGPGAEECASVGGPGVLFAPWLTQLFQAAF